MIVSTHRGHGHTIAKGADIRRMMAELLGKSNGYCKGKGGSMHIADFSIGMLGANGIVGAGLPIATGAALAAQMEGSDRVSVAFFGDGASNEGAFHEALNLAAVWKLPVIFVCENNLWASSVSSSETVSVQDISSRAASYNIPGVTVDGNDVLAVHEARLRRRRARPTAAWAQPSSSARPTAGTSTTPSAAPSPTPVPRKRSSRGSAATPSPPLEHTCSTPAPPTPRS